MSRGQSVRVLTGPPHQICLPRLFRSHALQPLAIFAIPEDSSCNPLDRHFGIIVSRAGRKAKNWFWKGFSRIFQVTTYHKSRNRASHVFSSTNHPADSV